jgi:hypothetical protein
MAGSCAQMPSSFTSSVYAPKYVWSVSDGRVFDGPTALASHLGVSTGAVCNAAKEAYQRESSTFHCGGQSCSRRQLVQEIPPDPISTSTHEDSTTHKVQYLLTLVPVMQAHAHLQAAALRLCPGRKLRCPTLSVHQIQSIRSWSMRDAAAGEQVKFDLAQLWSLHSPSSYASQYGFRRALLGEPQEKPVSELSRGKYTSLSYFTHDQLSRPSVAMSAEDIIRFMMSDFARKGQYDEIFEDADTIAQDTEKTTALKKELTPEPPDAPEPAPGPDAPVPPAAPAPRTPPPSPRRAFAAASMDRMRELQEHLRTGAQLLEESEPLHSRKRRRLALAAIGSISKVLFDANKLVLDVVIDERVV